jgi:hypothetical protein
MSCTFKEARVVLCMRVFGQLAQVRLQLSFDQSIVLAVGQLCACHYKVQPAAHRSWGHKQCSVHSAVDLDALGA